jgi:Rod binding domain-containing protein
MGTSIGLSSLSSQTSLLQSKEASTMQQMKSAKGLSDAAKIDKGSQQFEAILIGSWLKDAEQSFGSVPGGNDNQDSGGEQMMSLGVQSLATSMAASGGIGIGKMIAKAMHATQDKLNPQPATTANAAQPAAATSTHEKRGELR